MLAPIEPGILASAFVRIRGGVKHIDFYSAEFQNTTANCFYWESFILHHGMLGFDFIAPKDLTKNSIKYYASYKAIFVCDGANLIRSMTKTMDSYDVDGRAYWAQIILDHVKYNIKNAHKKSLARRYLERIFVRPFPEHRGLWDLMNMRSD
jgi:hypothetical protein